MLTNGIHAAGLLIGIHATHAPQDCGHKPTEDVIRGYEHEGVTLIKVRWATGDGSICGGTSDPFLHPGFLAAHLSLTCLAARRTQQPDLSDPPHPAKDRNFVGYYKIARHFRFALTQMFDVFKYDSVVIVEDDLEIAPVCSLWCASLGSHGANNEAFSAFVAVRLFASATSLSFSFALSSIFILREQGPVPLPCPFLSLPTPSVTHGHRRDSHPCPSQDFFSYFAAGKRLLQQDPSLFCVSAWNDNGKPGNALSATRLYRSDFFPGLGWMMLRSLWDGQVGGVTPEMAGYMLGPTGHCSRRAVPRRTPTPRRSFASRGPTSFGTTGSVSRSSAETALASGLKSPGARPLDGTAGHVSSQATLAGGLPLCTWEHMMPSYDEASLAFLCSIGVSQGQFYDQYLKFIKLNDVSPLTFVFRRALRPPVHWVPLTTPVRRRR